MSKLDLDKRLFNYVSHSVIHFRLCQQFNELFPEREALNVYNPPR